MSELKPRPKVRVVIDVDHTHRVYVDDILVHGNPDVDVKPDDRRGPWRPYGDGSLPDAFSIVRSSFVVQLTFREAEIEIQRVDPDAKLALDGRPTFLPPLVTETTEEP